MIVAQNVKLKNLIRFCAVCGKKLSIIVYPTKSYKGGHFFGKIEMGRKKKVEYWECNRCYAD